jgi:hypothetical protein
MRQHLLSLIVVGAATAMVATSPHAVGRQLVLAPLGYVAVDVPVALTPDPDRVPFTTIPAGTRVRIVGRSGEWYEISFRDQHWGERVGYVKMRHVVIIDDTDAPPTTPRNADVPVRQPSEPTTSESSATSLAGRLERSSLSGWTEARKLAAAGGAVELLGPVKRALEELDLLKNGELGLEVEYAQTAIRAAVAASQDERPEMELLLTHARDLSERLVDRGRRAQWPRSFNLLAGELWLEVDRYDEARRAFERAVKVDGSADAWAGLARAHARMGNKADACKAYRQIQGAGTALLTEARAFLATCP